MGVTGDTDYRALEATGVEFIDENGGPKVRLKKRSHQKNIAALELNFFP
jgi:hypothetical protein